MGDILRLVEFVIFAKHKLKSPCRVNNAVIAIIYSTVGVWWSVGVDVNIADSRVNYIIIYVKLRSIDWVRDSSAN